jgi:hypothetical protein
VTEETILKATHTGELKIGDLHFECAVLEDGSRIVSETQFMKQMGMYRSGALSVRRKQSDNESGAQTPLSLAYKNLKPFVDIHLTGVHFQPVTYRTVKGSVSTAGLRADIIPKVCEVWIDADRAGVLGHRQKMIAAKADILLRGMAHVGIISLVDEATGYQEIRDKQALQAILDRYLRQEFADWAKRFPDEFYKQMFRLRGWQWRGMRVNRPSVVGKYTNDLVYQRLAPGILDELQKRNPKDEKGNREGKHHQLLTGDTGVPALSQHLFATVGFMRASTSWDQFYRMMQRAFPKLNSNLVLNFPEPEDMEA